MGISIPYFAYNSQNKVYQESDTAIDLNETITISSFIGSTANEYQWFQDANSITGANEPEYTILASSDLISGIYHCEITNSLVPDLTISTNNIEIEVIEDSYIRKNRIHLNISISPNPAKDYISTQRSEVSNKELEVAILDVQGRTLISKTYITRLIKLILGLKTYQLVYIW